jgi:Mg2+/Co2+ transporter CorB
MSKIYLLLRYDYDESEVIGVFTSKELAESIKSYKDKKYGNPKYPYRSNYFIEEHTLINELKDENYDI